MKPSDLLYARVKEHLLAPMRDLGFNYSKSQKTFKRRVGDFTQVIYMHSSFRNHEDYCSILPGFHVECRAYGRWYEKTWGVPASTISIWASSEWGIPGWPRKPRKAFFGLITKEGPPVSVRLTNSDEDEVQMGFLKDALTGPALAQLDKVSSYEGAAQANCEGFPDSPWIACDLFMMTGDTEKAAQVIEDGIKKANRFNNYHTPEIVAELEARRAKYFSGDQDYGDTAATAD